MMMMMMMVNSAIEPRQLRLVSRYIGRSVVTHLWFIGILCTGFIDLDTCHNRRRIDTVRVSGEVARDDS
jgi:hypothetical protein